MTRTTPTDDSVLLAQPFGRGAGLKAHAMQLGRLKTNLHHLQESLYRNVWSRYSFMTAPRYSIPGIQMMWGH